MHIINSKIIELCETFITKSTVDLETELLSENETDTEIENEGSEEPEYDAIEEDLDL